ncbi:MAG: FtsK/SpoIIIE domain-containing protein [Thermoanaerobaculia bacterium]
MHLPFLLGTDPSGTPIELDLASLPHLLVAGTTGSGKSVFLNSLLSDIIERSSAKLVLIDPKRVEFHPYKSLAPVYVKEDAIVDALNWLVEEMDRRFILLEGRNVRDIDQYNRERPLDDKLDRIVVVIDELANLMLSMKDRVEVPLTRVAQMARAVGIHLVLATQRPTVNVVTGLLKANIPGRVSFGVITATDSRVILDEEGAEALLAKGEMLARIPGVRGLRHLQGRFTSLEDVERVVRTHTEVH